MKYDIDLNSLYQALDGPEDPLLRLAIADRLDELGCHDQARAVRSPCWTQCLSEDDCGVRCWPLHRFFRVIYWYESGDYDGSGEALAHRLDGLFEGMPLGHCSCDGPGQDWGCNPPKPITWVEVRRRAGPEDAAVGSNDTLWKLINAFSKHTP